MSDLKPCPFCGASENDADRRLFRVIIGGLEMVECRGCGTLTRETSWSRRAAPPIGARYRNESGEAVAVVVPSEATHEMLVAGPFAGEEYVAIGHAAIYEAEEQAWRDMLAALPEPE